MNRAGCVFNKEAPGTKAAGPRDCSQVLPGTSSTIPDGGLIDELYCFDVPVSATFQGGAAFVRFRLSPNGGLPADGQTILPF